MDSRTIHVKHIVAERDAFAQGLLASFKGLSRAYVQARLVGSEGTAPGEWVRWPAVEPRESLDKGGTDDVLLVWNSAKTLIGSRGAQSVEVELRLAQSHELLGLGALQSPSNDRTELVLSMGNGPIGIAAIHKVPKRVSDSTGRAHTSPSCGSSPARPRPPSSSRASARLGTQLDLARGAAGGTSTAPSRLSLPRSRRASASSLFGTASRSGTRLSRGKTSRPCSRRPTTHSR